MSPSPDADLLAPAARLCVDAGQLGPPTLKRLSGGKNNRVFLLTLVDSPPLILKSYFRHAQDPRDRLGAEWSFLNFVWSRGVRCVPEPLALDRMQQLGLYGFVEGNTLAEGEITASHVEAAAAFICDINAESRLRGVLEPGSEACFSISDHLRRVDRRVERLGTLDSEAPHAEEAAALVAEELTPSWQQVRTGILDACDRAGLATEAPIPEREIIASPSDFGFHNALWHNKRGLSFLDFEYAGLDDPAKLAGDFFNCPEVPTPGEHFGLFVDAVSRGLQLSDAACARMYMLRDVYRIKWACIVLNDFLPDHDARRRFANQGDRIARCSAQLKKAAALIAKTASA